MAKFQIEVEEVLQRVVEVKANSLEEALEKVEEQYHNEEIVLDYEDYKGTEIREYKDASIQHYQKENDLEDISNDNEEEL